MEFGLEKEYRDNGSQGIINACSPENHEENICEPDWNVRYNCVVCLLSSHISLAGPTEGLRQVQRRSNGRKPFPNALKQFSFIFGFLSKLCFSLDPIKINHGIKKETFPDILPFLRFRSCLSPSLFRLFVFLDQS